MPVNVPDEERGPIREFMVRFDEPQLDADGDGPYVSASVWESISNPWTNLSQRRAERSVDRER